MTPEEFFHVLGFLTNQNRSCKLDAEVRFEKEQTFREIYRRLSGINPVVGDHNFYHWPQGANKWGTELRIYFNADRNNIPATISGKVVKPRFVKTHNCRINSNSLIWELIRYGFLLSDTQDAQRIRECVPTQYISFFEEGFLI